MGEEWRTLTFGDLRPGDVIKVDEDGPEETVRVADDDIIWFRTDLSCGHRDKPAPVLVRFPRPEAAS